MALIDFPMEALTYSTAALPYSGDADAGAGGLTTSAATNETNLAVYGVSATSQLDDGSDIGTDVFPDTVDNPVAQHPFWTVALFVGLLVLLAIGTPADDQDDRLVRISAGNGARITLMALLGFLFLKWFFGLVRFPSISPTIAYV